VRVASSGSSWGPLAALILGAASGVIAGCTELPYGKVDRARDTSDDASQDDTGVGDTADSDTSDSGSSGGGEDPSCVYGALRSDTPVVVVGEVDDVLGDLPLAGVSIVNCADGQGELSGEGGGWSVTAPDAGYVTMLATIDGAAPAQWLFDPRIEGISTMPYRADMIWTEFISEISGSLGVTYDPTTAIVVIEAMDPDTTVDLEGAVVATVPAAETYITISIEGPPVLSNTTNGLHDVASFNVPAGLISIEVDAGPDRTCRVPDAIEVPPGGLLALTAYCPLNGG
jgi:hypothetical protein